jgi:transcriptional regulator with XRE-family HTH domain
MHTGRPYLNRLRTIRQRRGLTQAQLADLIGVSRPFISELETGAKRPDFDTLNRLARVLHVPIDELYTNDDSNPFPAPEVNA